MTKTDEILATARTRTPGQPYAGAVTPQEAFELLQSDPRVKLVDVRTNAEHGAVQWSLYPGGAPNPDFATQLQNVAAPDDVVLFLCRSGVRSRHAARTATELGYGNAFDILEGFEGDRDPEGELQPDYRPLAVRRIASSSDASPRSRAVSPARL